MLKGFKRLLALLLAVAIAVSFVPGAQAADTQVLTQEDYAAADDLFARIDALEAAPAKRSTTQSQLTDAAVALVTASDSYVEGSLERTGDSFTWWTADGIRCIYSPRMRKLEANMSQTGEDAAVNEPQATRGGSPQGNQVYVIGPYYGYDSEFTDQYKSEAKRVATAIGDTDGYTLYSGKAATVDKVAEAVSSGAVVFFDSHGTTDYENGDDFVSGATNSYLCLTSTTGLTTEDYNDGALYYSDGICVNGATIANHMQTDSPGGILWMALCMGMATDTLCAPLREKGVEVVYGYSQSVTFAGDYLFEETFWDEMLKGNTVADSVATMKTQWGNWDWSTKIAKYYCYYDGYTTISEARADYMAFPVVVSDEDTHPGQRYKNSFYGACGLQTVKSTYTLNLAEDTTQTPETPEISAGDSATIVFDDLSKRTQISAAVQVWEENGITVSNHKADATSDVNGAYYDPIRLYKLSTLTVEYPQMIKLEMQCNASKYVTPLVDALEYQFDSNITSVETDGNMVSVSFAQPVSDFTVAMSQGQVRLDKITVYIPQQTQEPQQPGELDGVEGITEDDAIYLLQHVLMPEQFPVGDKQVDLDNSGTVDESDAIYLLLHILLPEYFPLS